MKFSIKNALISAAVTITSLNGSIMPAQSAETFLSPRLFGNHVARCVESYRYPDGCSKAARKEAANRFCYQKGFGKAQKWQWQDRHWDNRVVHRVYTERYNDGKREKVWVAKEGGFVFTTIVCNDK